MTPKTTVPVVTSTPELVELASVVDALDEVVEAAEDEEEADDDVVLLELVVLELLVEPDPVAPGEELEQAQSQSSAGTKAKGARFTLEKYHVLAPAVRHIGAGDKGMLANPIRRCSISARARAIEGATLSAGEVLRGDELPRGFLNA